MLNTSNTPSNSPVSQSYLQRIVQLNPDQLRNLEEYWKDHLSEAKNPEHQKLIQGYINDISEILLYRQ